MKHGRAALNREKLPSGRGLSPRIYFPKTSQFTSQFPTERDGILQEPFKRQQKTDKIKLFLLNIVRNWLG